jgi:RNA polymerase sigma-70 factor (ECF subfamily)
MFRRKPALDLAKLVHAHHAELYRYAYRLSGSREDAEDLTQQVFLIAGEKGGQLRDEAATRSWLYTVLRHQFLKERRRKAPAAASAVSVELDGMPGAMRPESPVDGERLQSALNAMPLEFKVVLLLFFFEDLSYKEISRQLNIPMGTVMSRLSRGKDFLRRRLEESDTPAALVAAGK